MTRDEDREAFELLDFRAAVRELSVRWPGLRKLPVLPPPILKFLDYLLQLPIFPASSDEERRIEETLIRLARAGKLTRGLPNARDAYPAVRRAVPPGFVERFIDEDRDGR